MWAGAASYCEGTLNTPLIILCLPVSSWDGKAASTEGAHRKGEVRRQDDVTPAPLSSL